MGVASLISWFVTAFVGLYLLTVWLIENDVSQRAVRSRLPGPVIGGHVLLALTGLVCWVVHLLFGSASWGWAALGVLGGVATLGLTMFTRWIPVHAAYMAAEAAGSRSAESDFPAERAFPVTVVTIHGVLAVTTVTLVLLTVLGAGGG
jgi:manganese efflux pump family protein